MAKKPHEHHDRPHRHHYDAEMLSVEEARERILSYFQVLPVESAELVDSLGQVLGEDMVASFDIPPLANSAMDGYAVLAADTRGASAETPVELVVTGVVAAGQIPDHPLEPGTAVRIMTGAPVPDNADAVVPFEDTDELERRASGGSSGAIAIHLQAEPYDNVRGAGEDIESGETVLESGQILRAGEIGVIASLGHSTVKAIRRPVVAIVSTGDELLQPGDEPEPGKIFNSNAFSIAAMVKRYGGVPKILGIAKDTIESLEAALEEALDADLVVTSAGVSKGDYDVVKDVLSSKGEIALWSVRMRPAKPLAFGVLDRNDGTKVPHLGLPGNPVSAMVAFEQFGRSAIRLMMGKPEVAKPSVEAIMDDPIRNHDGRRVYARVHVYRDESGEYRARSTGNQSSGVLSSMSLANGLAICPDDIGMISAGEIAKVEILDWPDDIF
ncbi:MAG: molybdopterin molybdotransferase MoeA [Chloroflexi bacterium]|jgi:molybdopterin molybdotransferase|nr:molybdopterin molybdotransferase MoeA [Chloroflexota bacterium]MBT3863873.1 molybdopterin molybdotransferase MoeA [Chloroflexota bacterium]MBT4141687.1 molybdopterin molybdotransferase MoeA [Chloroflexota bacterium]MBT4942844.1 molybdopterin molybdotransferase MoeA [Chloroflexota bacterium]MBT5252574.1 molybdopterin molybdotransferase MoeA [Chloroflexota bacterium]